MCGDGQAFRRINRRHGRRSGHADVYQTGKQGGQTVGDEGHGNGGEHQPEDTGRDVDARHPQPARQGLRQTQRRIGHSGDYQDVDDQQAAGQLRRIFVMGNDHGDHGAGTREQRDGERDYGDGLFLHALGGFLRGVAIAAGLGL